MDEERSNILIGGIIFCIIVGIIGSSICSWSARIYNDNSILNNIVVIWTILGIILSIIFAYAFEIKDLGVIGLIFIIDVISIGGIISYYLYIILQITSDYLYMFYIFIVWIVIGLICITSIIKLFVKVAKHPYEIFGIYCLFSIFIGLVVNQYLYYIAEKYVNPSLYNYNILNWSLIGIFNFFLGIILYKGIQYRKHPESKSKKLDALKKILGYLCIIDIITFVITLLVLILAAYSEDVSYILVSTNFGMIVYYTFICSLVFIFIFIGLIEIFAWLKPTSISQSNNSPSTVQINNQENSQQLDNSSSNNLSNLNSTTPIPESEDSYRPMPFQSSRRINGIHHPTSPTRETFVDMDRTGTSSDSTTPNLIPSYYTGDSNLLIDICRKCNQKKIISDRIKMICSSCYDEITIKLKKRAKLLWNITKIAIIPVICAFIICIVIFAISPNPPIFLQTIIGLIFLVIMVFLILNVIFNIIASER
ncbi:MAG: hypothetical protein ACTSPY_06030 [Candidatus Helarchaeota archaeon]